MSKKSVLGLVMGWLAAAFVFAACFFLDSCNVGLGESVDTEAPTIKVTYPSNSSTVRGKMVLYGICGDDKGVSSITVSVTDNSTKTSVDDRIVNRTATISDSTWRLEIDTTSLTDGNYTFSATARDDAGHTTSSQGTYDIDNHAPLFIISSPTVARDSLNSSGEAKDASKYGSTFQIEGTIADSHSISKMELTVYNKDGTWSKTYEATNVATAGGTTVIFANGSSKKEGTDLYTTFYEIYDNGTDTDDAHEFYATVKLYDSAYEYTNPTGETEEIGNTTTTLYLYDDVYSEVMSNSEGLGLTAADLMSIMNGTSAESSETQSKAKAYLEAAETDTSNSEQYLYFSINPKASPIYTVNGYTVNLDDEKLDAEDDIRQLSSDGTISISYQSVYSLYGTAYAKIEPYGNSKTGTPSLKVWMRKISSSLPSNETATGYLSDLAAAVKTAETSGATFETGTTKVGDSSDWLLIYDYASASDSGSVADETFTVTLPSNLEGGSYYMFGVTGCDMDKIYFAQDTTYVFRATTQGYAANVKITDPSADDTYTNEAGLTFTGSATLSSDENLYVQQIQATFTYKVGSESSIEAEKLNYFITKNDDGSFTVKKLTGKDASGNYITDVNDSGYEAEDVSDSDALKYYAEPVYQKDENGNETTTIEHSAGDFEFDVSKIVDYDTLKFALESGKVYTYTLAIDVASSSGNLSYATRSIYVDTVAPVFDDTNSSVGGVKTIEKVLNTWFSSESLKVSGTLTDAGSGVSEVDYWLDNETSEEADGTFVPSVNDDGEYKFSGAIAGFSESTTEKPTHTLTFIALDKAGNKSSAQTYTVKVDMTSPDMKPLVYTMGSEISGSASGNVLTNKENDVVVYGLVSDTASGLESIEIPEIANAKITYSKTTASVTTGTGDTAVTTLVENLSNADALSWFKTAEFADYDSTNATLYTAWKAEIAKADIVAGDIKYSAKDTAGNENKQRLFTFTVDTTKPEVEYKDLTDADSDTDGTQVNGKITLSGTASDNNQMNSITEIQYRIGDDGTWTAISDGINTNLTSAYSWTSNEIDTSTLFSESKTTAETVYFRAIALDAAGNYSDDTDSEIKVSVDQNTDRPVVRISSLDESGDIISSQSVMGTVSDDDGVSKFEYSSDGGTSWNEIELTSGSWKIDGLAAGNYSLTFRVTDKIGTVFTTNETKGTFATYDRPYLMLAKDTEKKDNTSAITFSVDLNAPEIKTLKLAATSDTTALDSTSASWSKNSVNFGADAKYLWIYIEANEDVAVHASAKDDISVKIGQTSIDFTTDNFTNVTFSRTPEGSVSGDLTYIAGPIEIAKVEGAEGTQTVSVTVKDASTRESSATQNIYIDEGAPEVSITSPNATQAEAAESATNGVSTTTEAITGIYTIKGRVADTSGIASFKYLIPTQAQISNGVTSSTDGWKSVNSLSGSAIDGNETKLTSSQWAITFDSSSFESEEGKSSLIYYATAKSDGNLIYAESITDSTNVYVPLYFYVEDSTGNGEIVQNKILVDPQGGVPTIEIITPDNLAKTGGNLNLQGTASDDEKVSKVVLTNLQFSSYEATSDNYSSTSDATFDWKDVTAAILNTDGVVTKGTVVSEDSNVTITADGTNSWKISINTSKISDTDLTSLLGSGNELKTVRATIVSYDENGTPSNFDVQTLAAGTISSDSSSDENSENYTTSYVRRTIFVDKNAPKLVTTQLVQFADGTTVSATATPSVIRTYSAGMYISGKVSSAQWYLKGVVEDDASVTGISITTSGSGYISLVDTVGSDSATEAISSESGSTTGGMYYSGLGTKEFTFLIPIDTSTEGQFYPTIEMWDGQHTDVTSNVSFFVDNDAPSLYTTSDEKTATLGHASTLRLVSNGLNVSTTNVVENSDGSYSFGDTTVEARSGLDFIAVYFKKAANSTFNTKNRVYSPLFANSTSVPNVVEIADSKTTDSVYINSEYLPALVKTVTRSDASHISYDGLGSNGFIKPYTVVKMAGSYVRITGIENDVATLASDVPTDVTECEFIYAQIVDHAVSEGFASDGSISNDDEDGFVETLKQTGSSYKWSASVYSDNIPDGPAEIHVVAFDAAGNFNAGYVETSIANNRPRISKVLLATDLDGNGKFDFYNSDESILNDLSDDDTVQNGSQFGEYVFYSTLKVSDTSASGVAQAKVTLNAPKVFNVKKDLLVLPEFVSGNGALKYAYSLDNSKAVSSPVAGSGETLYTLANTVDDLKLANKTKTDGTETNQKVASLVQATAVSDSDSSLKYGGVVLTMNSTTHKDLDDGNVKYLAFTFWDNTSETIQGTDSLWAMVNIPAYIDVVDNKAPESTIKPFWWESADDYKSSFVYDSDGVAQGHISNITDDDRAAGTKPGVSGKVYIDGTSYDETRLGEIHVVKPNGTIGGDGDEKIIWRALVDGSTTEYEWKKADGAEIIEEEEPSQDGHTITWRYQIDMTSYGVATDKVVKTYAVDAQENTETVAETQTTTKTETPYYKMDFVPYIKSIYTTEIGSANRSRLGKFPVRAGEEMTIEGMNFAKDATYKVYFYKSDSSGGVPTSVDSTADGTYVSDGKITVAKAPEYSRWVTVGVTPTGGTEVKTPNNDVTDVSKILGCDIEEGYVSGSYKVDSTRYTDNGYAKANNAGTNFWTNNRYISVWNVATDTLFAGSINPHSGVIKKIDKYNSGSGAPTNVTASKGGTTDAAAGPGGGYLYKQAGYATAVDPNTSMNDSYYAAISSDDLKLYGYVSGTTYSDHGDNIAFNSSEVAYVAPVDEMDYTIVNGMPYYVFQDNGLGGQSGSVWGLGLVMMREGIWYDRTYFNPYNGNTIEEAKLPYFVERQGYNKASHARDSSTGYDSVLYQFKNPRITGYYKSDDTLLYSSKDSSAGGYTVKGVDYIYISYYDSFAKCLKYAAYRVGHRFASNDSKYSNTILKEWGKSDVDDNLDIVAEMTSSPNTTGNQTAQKTFNHMIDGASVVAGSDTTSNNPSPTVIAGEWSDIFVDSTTASDPRPVIIYYNKTAKSLEVAYGNNSFPQATSEWTKTTGIRPKNVTSDFGRYVSAAMDTSGNLHVAAQDADKAKLYYLYLTKSGSTYTVAKSVAVDACAGRWTDVELTDAAGSTLADIMPVISYIDTTYMGTSSGVKAAYLVDVDSNGEPVFEAMTDPAYYTSSDQRTSVMPHVKETKSGSVYSPVAVGFNADKLALDFLRGEE